MYTIANNETAPKHIFKSTRDHSVACGFTAMTIKGYKITGEIGHGGMSVVYVATRVVSAEMHSLAPVAVKVFDAPEGPHRTELAKKFMQEAKILAALDHPNLIKVFDCGIADDGRPWLAMELVENSHGGASLASRLSASKPLSTDEVAHIYSQLRAALAFCHGKGIVHGDVKAENVLIASDGTVKLSDFGIARVLQPDTRRAIGVSTVTLEGNLGTPYVRAPECRNGEKATTAADVYSFGVLLYKLVTGIWYEGSSRLLEQARAFAPDWAPVLKRMLASNPARRFSDAAALPESPTEEARRSRFRRRARIVGLTSAVVLLAAFAAYRLAKTHATATIPTDATTRETAPRIPPPPPNGYQSYIDERGLTDAEWAYYILGTNEYDFVEEATLTRTNRLVLTRPVVYGTLHLPDTNGTVEVESPPGYEGYVVMARRVDGDLFYQMHVVRKGKLRVRASNRSIRVSYRPFPRIPDP